MHDMPLMMMTHTRIKAVSAPCMTRGKAKGTSKLATGLKSYQAKMVSTGCSSKAAGARGRPRGSPSARSSTKHSSQVRSTEHSFPANGEGDVFHTPKTEPPPLTAKQKGVAASLMLPRKVEKLAKAWATRTKSKAVPVTKSGVVKRISLGQNARGHGGIGTVEIGGNWKEEEEEEDESQSDGEGKEGKEGSRITKNKRGEDDFEGEECDTNNTFEEEIGDRDSPDQELVISNTGQYRIGIVYKSPLYDTLQ